MVKDAIACMGCVRELDTSLEISLFGIIPDIVVIHRNGKLVFVIEVKSPNRVNTNNNVCESESVAGQIWLYLMSMKQSGVEKPLGAICTFNQIRLVSLSPMGDHMFPEAFRELQETDTVTWKTDERQNTKGQASSDPGTRKASSRSKKIASVCNSDTNIAREIDGVKILKASLYGSPIKNAENVFPMLLLGLKTANIEADTSSGPTQTVTVADIGDDLGKRMLAFATEENLFFALTSDNLKVNGNFPRDDCKNFFLLDTIGLGHRGDVSLVITTSGACAAVKFYHFKPSRAATPDLRKEHNQQAWRQPKTSGTRS